MFSKTAIEKKYHFSVDDVFEELLRISDIDGKLFDSPMFAFLKEVYEQYGTHTSLYLFYEKDIDGKIRSLKEVKSFSEELLSVDWLHFAPHAKNFETPPFDQGVNEFREVCDQIYNEIERISGKKAFASLVRLHFYSEIYELAEYFLSKNVQALYVTDRLVGVYRLPKDSAKELLDKGLTFFSGIYFLRTQFRVENITGERLKDVDIKEHFSQNFNNFQCITLYTHEYELQRSEVRNVMRRCLGVLKSIGLESFTV